MRQTISGLVAAIAVMAASAVPAMACGCRQVPCAHESTCRRRSIRVATAAAAAGAMSGCPIRCSSIIMSIRARPIPVPATSRRYPTYQESACPAGAPITSTVMAMTAATHATTHYHRRHDRIMATRTPAISAIARYPLRLCRIAMYALTMAHSRARTLRRYY